MFMKAVIAADDGRSIPIMTMGPICIAPELKRKGYGKILLDYSLEKAKELGCGALCFEGNIDFYGKSGFKQAREFGIRYHGLEERDDASFFLCKELISGYLDGITGEYATPAGYLVNEKQRYLIESSRIWRRKNFRDRFLNDEKQEINLDESNGKRLVSEKLDVGYPEYVMGRRYQQTSRFSNQAVTVKRDGKNT